MGDGGQSSRYADEGEIARGGMGVIIKVKDRDLDRTLAMKRMLSAPDVAGGEIEVDRFARFMEEAHVTAQLDHPAIVPVHDLGTDADGTAWYTMKMVRGRELGEVIKLAREGDEGWNLPRLIGVLVRVNQAVAYAHGKGVIHRDLKPANIMVGDLGEVYVMDWGLAKQLGRDDVHDIRLQLGDELAQTGLDTIVSPRTGDSASGSSLDAPLMTMDGSVVGTPAYMPPEQAAGIVDQVDHLSDIYALGAVLYEILAAQSPYMDSGGHTSPKEVLTALSNGPPTKIKRIRPDAPAELVAICDKAMSRAREDRYGSCLELADDLQAFLDGRVVQAFQTGSWAELKKLILRNRLASAAAAVAVLLLASLAVVQTVSKRKVSASLAKEEEARDRVLLTLADMYRNTGLREPDRLRAALWFARAAVQAEGDSERVAANRTRARSWSSGEWVTVRAFRTKAPDGALRFRFHPEHPLLIVETYKGVELWDLDAEKLLALPAEQLAAAAFSPDGATLATAAPGGRVQLWGLPELEKKAELPHPASALAFDAEGDRLAFGDKQLRVWGFAEGAVVGEPIVLPKPAVWVSFLPDADELAVAYPHALCIYDLAEPSSDPRFGPVDNDCRPRAMRPVIRDGVLFGSALGRPEQVSHPYAKAWDLRSGEVVLDEPALNKPLDVGPGGRLLLFAGGLWDRDTGDVRHDLQGEDWGDNGSFHPGGAEFVYGLDALATWGTASGERVRTVSETSGRATWSPDGSLLAVGSNSGLVRVLRTAARPDVEGFSSKIGPRLPAVSADGSLIVNLRMTGGGRRQSGPASRIIRVRRLADGCPAGPGIVPGGLPVCAAFGKLEEGELLVGTSTEFAERFASQYQLGAVRRFDFRTGEALGPRLLLPSEPAHLLRQGDGFLVLCRGGEVLRLDDGEDAPIKLLQASPIPPRTERRNGQMQLPGAGDALLVSSWKQVECFDFPRGTKRWSIGSDVFNGNTITGDAAGGDKVVLCSVAPFTLEVGAVATDLATGQQRVRVDVGNLGANWLTFDPAGERLLVATGDNRARVIDAATWQPASSPVAHTRPGTSGVFLPGVPWVVSAGSNDDMRIWDSRTGLDVAPPRTLGGSLWMELAASGEVLALSSRNHRRTHLVDLRKLRADAEGERSPREGLRLAELNAGAVIDSAENLTRLDDEEWLERWQEYRQQFPEEPGRALRIPAADLVSNHRDRIRSGQALRDGSFFWELRRWRTLAPEDPEPLLRMFFEQRLPEGEHDASHWIAQVLAHPAYRRDPETLIAICRLKIHRDEPGWGRLERALTGVGGGYEWPPVIDPALRAFIAAREEFPQDVRAWLTRLLFEPEPPLEEMAFEAAVEAGGDGALQIATRWEAVNGIEGRTWNDLETGGDHLVAQGDGPVDIADDGALRFGGSAGPVWLSDPAKSGLADSPAFSVAVRFRPADAGGDPLQQGNFYEAAQLVSADFPYDGDDWGLGYADNAVWFGVGDAAKGGTPTLHARPAGRSMAGQWWTVVATWTTDGGGGKPSFAVWLLDGMGNFAGAAGPIDPNQVAGTGDGERFGSPRQRTGIVIGADRGQPDQHRFRGHISSVRLYRGAATPKDAAALANP